MPLFCDPNHPYVAAILLAQESRMLDLGLRAVKPAATIYGVRIVTKAETAADSEFLRSIGIDPEA